VEKTSLPQKNRLSCFKNKDLLVDKLHMTKKVFLYLFITITLASETNPWGLSLFERIVNRKHISHIIMETRPDHYRVSLIVSDRFPYNYKSVSYAFFLRYQDAKTAQETARILDKHLDLGLEIKLFLKGSEVTSYKLLGN